MKKTLGYFIGAALLGLTAVGTAHATTLFDFTDSSVWKNNVLTSTQDGIKATLTTNPTAINFTKFDGTKSNVGSDLYAHSNPSSAWDGVGINDDEVGGTEVLTLAFGTAVNVTRIDFLDLFKTTGDAEKVAVKFFNNATELDTKDFDGIIDFTNGTGYLSANVSIANVTSLEFSWKSGNDGVGIGDAALAAVQVSAVPIPAALPLFLSALTGFGFVGFRRRRA
ncbi:hypothetical protein ThidrDRAFT_2072 [Thiorhodococcus drewsii AZ1]|uniref:PEP motif anchor domain protein n=1 Tax=Thiorhodococcus drewsii AZ1 TaxID=765913 RepID=G2E1A9_9GAMM|nr:VPLPA-CTERM sorting domain-containing protein [Thiorhodococcus drewsii]EGV31206.1 hypothetical protein ThidrDRAFT_2072 [Thiorhodococcus drewsii AZ1]